ncbi:hypothetical protein LX36DRAFT_663223 [Colletotrichum falcatum]|nr:hypothetical protein LX36DRAFT_663223 [Colletotrichum falcatum]
MQRAPTSLTSARLRDGDSSANRPVVHCFSQVVFACFQLPWRNEAHSYDISMYSFLVDYFSRYGCPFSSVARSVASSPDGGRSVSLSFVVLLEA